jgi:hypothetical protein
MNGFKSMGPSRRPNPRRHWFPPASPAPDVGAGVREALPSTFGSRAKACALLLSLILAGCVETGDFGRPKASLWNDVVLPATGSLAARERGEPVSAYVLTDDEEELRDRAWRFVMPAHERAWFDGLVAELVRTRILPVSMHPDNPATYHAALLRGPFRSPASRYRRLSEDAVADTRLIGPFTATAARVIAADKARLRSLAYVRDLTEEEVRHAAGRVAENRCLIAWVRQEIAERLESYRYALEHLFIEAPQNEAIPAERTLPRLDAQRRMLDALAIPPLAGLACIGSNEGAAVLYEEKLAPVPLSAPIVVKD